MTAGNRARGFTLIEVLVATVILAGALAVLFPTYADTMRRLRGVERRQTALMVARSVMAGVEAAPLVAARQGVASSMRWTVSLAPEGHRAGDLAAYRILVSVYPSSGAMPVQLAGIVLVSAPPGSE